MHVRNLLLASVGLAAAAPVGVNPNHEPPDQPVGTNGTDTGTPLANGEKFRASATDRILELQRAQLNQSPEEQARTQQEMLAILAQPQGLGTEGRSEQLAQTQPNINLEVEQQYERDQEPDNRDSEYSYAYNPEPPNIKPPSYKYRLNPVPSGPPTRYYDSDPRESRRDSGIEDESSGPLSYNDHGPSGLTRRYFAKLHRDQDHPHEPRGEIYKRPDQRLELLTHWSRPQEANGPSDSRREERTDADFYYMT